MPCPSAWLKNSRHSTRAADGEAAGAGPGVVSCVGVSFVGLAAGDGVAALTLGAALRAAPPLAGGELTGVRAGLGALPAGPPDSAAGLAGMSTAAARASFQPCRRGRASTTSQPVASAASASTAQPLIRLRLECNVQLFPLDGKTAST